MSPPDTAADRPDIVERRADVHRSRLLRIVDSLNARRHHAVALERKVVPTAAVLVGGGLIGVLAVLGVRHHLKQKERARLGPTLSRMFQRKHPVAERPPFVDEVARSAGLAVASFLVNRLLIVAADRLFHASDSPRQTT